MKIRAGFVSNSSSASFVIRFQGDPLLRAATEALNEKVRFITVKEIAREYLKAQAKNSEFEGFKKDKRKQALARLEKAPSDVDYVTFKACNYDCEIFQVDDNTVAISTCNNEYDAWQAANKILQEKYPSIKIEGDDCLPDEYGDKHPYYKYNATPEDQRKCYVGGHFNYVKMERDGYKIAILDEPSDFDIKFAQDH
jgi:hypothetical protein